MLPILVLLGCGESGVVREPALMTIELQRDVEVRKSDRLPDGSTHQLRATLYADTSFLLRKGQRLQMIAAYSEGECRVQIDKREYDLASCPWLPGFPDHQTDIFRTIPATAGK